MSRKSRMDDIPDNNNHLPHAREALDLATGADHEQVAQYLDQLLEKRAATRVQALASLITTLQSDYTPQTVEVSPTTLGEGILKCLRASPPERLGAAKLSAIIAFTTACQSDFESLDAIRDELVTRLSAAEVTERVGEMYCEALAVITLVNGTDDEEEEAATLLLDLAQRFRAPELVTAALGAWAVVVSSFSNARLTSRIAPK
jgi:hypothetical protein